MNNNTDFEYAVVGTLLLGDMYCKTMRDCVHSHALTSDAFTDPEMRTAFEVIMAEKTNNQTLLTDKVREKVDVTILEKATGKGCIAPGDAEKIVRKLAGNYRNNCMRKEFNKVMDEYGDKAPPQFIAQQLSHSFADIPYSAELDSELIGKMMLELTDSIPEDEDPNCLIHGRFLEKGHVLIFGAPSGVGKSVMVFQLIYAWALGREALGLCPIRPMRIGVFQSEDSEQDNAFFRDSMRTGYSNAGWIKDDLKNAESNVFFFDTKGRMGDEFISHLAAVQAHNRFDLLVINPLSGITDIDISDNTKVNELLRKKFDGIIKKENGAVAPCGMLIVHHTNKPPSANQRMGYGTDQYAQYIIAGASAFNNWMRSMLSLTPAKDGDYNFVAAKRGERLTNWPQVPGKKPTKIIRHAPKEEGIAFWYDVTPKATDDILDKPKTRTLEDDARKLAAELQKEAMTLTAARKFARKSFGSSYGDRVFCEIRDNLGKYSLIVRKTAINHTEFIGSEDSVEKQISKQVENISKNI